MKMLDTGIGSRLAGGFAIILVVMTTITLFALWRLHKANDMANYLVNEKIAKQQLAAEWLGAVTRNGVQANAIAKSDSYEVGLYFSERLREDEKLIDSLSRKMASKNNSPQEAALIAAIEQYRKAYVSIRSTVFQYKESGRTIEVEKLLVSEMDPKLKTYEAAVQNLLNQQKKQADAIAQESEGMYRKSIFMLAALGLLALAAGSVLAWALTISIIRPLRSAINFAAKVADGNLAEYIDMDRSDEIGELLAMLKKMNANLSHIVADIQDGIHSIDNSLNNIAVDNADLSSRTSEQAASLEEVAASMEQLTVTVKENADHAQYANQLAGSASDIAMQGGEIVSHVVTSMHMISSSSTKIADIIGVIDGIAFQTNILALNAAVEAARAGEQGRGFAVVASEVRQLAQRSAAAAKEIKQLIENSVEEVKHGEGLVDEAGITMKRILGSVNQLTNVIAEISAAGKEQSSALEQINQAIVQMDKTTQQNAAFVENAVSMAEALKNQSAHLAQSIGIFKTLQRPSRVNPQPLLPSFHEVKPIPASVFNPRKLKLVN